jgi:hypothetical protein
VKGKAYFIWVLPLRLMWGEVKDVAWFTRGLFR